MINTESLAQAIQFSMNIPEVQRHVQALEALPHRFKIYQLMATVTDHEQNIIRVFLNFSEKKNPNDYKEDALIEIQGSSAEDFRVLRIIPFELKP